ncbi:MAG: hypothetical protein AAF487_01030 [Bacteroidota bacterium]
MKEDKLKNFIDSNKEEFDVEFPSENLWNKIESDLDQKEVKVFSIRPYLPYAAAGIMIFLSVFFFLNKDNKNLAEDPVQSAQDNLVEDFGEVENYYSMQVNDKLRNLNEYDVDPELLEEINDLKSEFEELKVEMGYGADPGIVLEAMVENYRLRLEILESLLHAFEESKQEDNEIIEQ